MNLKKCESKPSLDYGATEGGMKLHEVLNQINDLKVSEPSWVRQWQSRVGRPSLLWQHSLNDCTELGSNVCCTGTPVSQRHVNSVQLKQMHIAQALHLGLSVEAAHILKVGCGLVWGQYTLMCLLHRVHLVDDFRSVKLDLCSTCVCTCKNEVWSCWRHTIRNTHFAGNTCWHRTFQVPYKMLTAYAWLADTWESTNNNCGIHK